MKDIEIFTYEGEGYRPVHDFGAWRVALLNHGERFDIRTMKDLECHYQTDEIFVLLCGQGELIVGEEMRRVPMEYGKVYNLPAGVYHGISVSEDARVLIVENADTTRENTDHKPLPASFLAR